MELLEILVEVAVEGCGLVRVFAVPETGGAGERDIERTGGVFLFVKVVRDGAVVTGGGDEHFDAEAFAELGGGGALVGAHGFENGFVIGGVDHDGDGAVIFCC